jgi:hypothetical protein
MTLEPQTVLIPNLEELTQSRDVHNSDMIPIRSLVAPLGKQVDLVVTVLSNLYFYGLDEKYQDDFDTFHKKVRHQIVSLMEFPLPGGNALIQADYSEDQILEGLDELAISILRDPLKRKDRILRTQRGENRQEMANRLNGRYGFFVAFRNYGLSEDAALAATNLFTSSNEATNMYYINHDLTSKDLPNIARVFATVHATFGFDETSLDHQARITQDLILRSLTKNKKRKDPYLDLQSLATIFAAYRGHHQEIQTPPYESWEKAIPSTVYDPTGSTKVLTISQKEGKEYAKILTILQEDVLAAFDPSTIPL